MLRPRTWIPLLALTLLSPLALQACRASSTATYASLTEAENSALLGSLRETVRDPERADRIARLFQDYAVAEAAHFQRVREEQVRLEELDRSYGTPRAAFDVRHRSLVERRRETALHAMVTFERIKAQLTPEEWAEVWTAVRALDGKWEALRP